MNFYFLLSFYPCLRLFLGLAVLVLSVSLYAKEAAQHQEVIVTASQLSADDIDTSFQTGHVTVISSENFDSKMATVADVLKTQTGVQIRQTGGLGSYSSISVRGSTGAQVNVYLDGVLINDAYGGSVDLSQFLLSSIDSIEIYRGNVPIQLGSAGIGGAINIKTKKSQANRKQLSLGSGSFGTLKSAVSVSSMYRDRNFFASLEHLKSDNDYEFLNNGQTTNDPTDDLVEKRQNAGLEQTSAFLSGSDKIFENWNLATVLNYSLKNNHIPNVRNSPENQANLEVENLAIQLKLDQKLNHNSALTYLLYGARRETLYDDTKGLVGLNKNLDETSSNTFGFKTVYASNIGSHFFNFTTQVRFEDYLRRDLIDPISQDISRKELTIAIQDEWLSDSGNLMLTARLGLRFNKDSGHQDKLKSNNYLDHHFGLRYQLTDTLSIIANISRDIRLPNLYELYGDLGSTIANEDLVEEIAFNTDLGIKGSFLNTKIYAGLFYRELDDAIVMIYNSRGIGQPDNISEARVYGAELELTKEIQNNWLLGLKTTHTQSENLSNIPSSRGNPLPGQYKNTASIINTWTHEKMIFELEYFHRSDGFYESSALSEAKMPTSNQYHFSIVYPFKNHRLEAQLKNLSDERIADYNRYPGPGRGVFFTYSLTL